MTRALWMIVLTACFACSGSDHSPARLPADQDAASDDATAELEGLVRDAVANWDDALHATCQCLVASGAFATLDDCVAPSASGPTWVPCGTTALAAQDSPQTRTIARCLRDELRTRADCLSSSACDSPEHANCADGQRTAMCASSDPNVVVAVLQACPDLGLLSRL